jgi:hypothetical protein
MSHYPRKHLWAARCVRCDVLADGSGFLLPSPHGRDHKPACQEVNSIHGLAPHEDLDALLLEGLMARKDTTVDDMKARGWTLVAIRKCSSPRCDVMVEFWRNPQTGKDSPYESYSPDTPYASLGPIFRRSHFASCPDAPYFRRRLL